MAAVALTLDERNAVIDWITADLQSERALDLFDEHNDRKRLIDYTEIAHELGFGEPDRDSYRVKRSLPALRRVLTGWRDVAEELLRSSAEAQGPEGVTDQVRVENRVDTRLELWATCQSILTRLEAGN